MPEPKNASRIQWSPSEWRDLTRALITIKPEYAAGLPATIPIAVIAQAIKTLPENRQRKVYSNTASKARPHLIKALAELRAEKPATPAAPPPRTEKIERAAKAKVTSGGRKIFWKPHEYLALATELHRQDPHTYINSSTLACLSPAALRAAEQRALPPDRQRNLATIAAYRPPLIEAFKELKQSLGPHKTVEEADAAALAAKRRDFAENPERYSPHKLQAKPAEPPVNPYEAVFKPLMDFFMGEFFRRMTQQYAPPRAQAQSLATPEVQNSVMNFQPPPKPIIGVVGALSVQGQDVQRAFPQYEVIHMQETAGNSPQILSSLRSAARVIGMTNFMKHSADGALAKHFGEKYMRVKGGTSAVKRQIEIWMKSGVLPNE